MKITVVQFALEGLADSDHPPIVVEGHLDLKQAKTLAQQYGDGYRYCACVSCGEDEELAFYANYSNEVKPPTNKDGTVERPSQGHLEIWFYHRETVSPPPTLLTGVWKFTR
jgi:hypothetical protein